MLDVFNFGTTPAINRLIVIANHKHLTGIASQHSDPGVLNGIGVLKLINEYMSEALAVVFQ